MSTDTKIRLGLYSDRAFDICYALMSRAHSISDEQSIAQASDGEVIVNCCNRLWTGMSSVPPTKKRVMHQFDICIEHLIEQALKCKPCDFGTLIKVKYEVMITSHDAIVTSDTCELITLYNYFKGVEMTTGTYKALVGSPHDPIKTATNEVFVERAKAFLADFDKSCKDSLAEHTKKCEAFAHEMFKQYTEEVYKLRESFAHEMHSLKQACESEQEFMHLVKCIPEFRNRMSDECFENIIFATCWKQ